MVKAYYEERLASDEHFRTSRRPCNRRANAMRPPCGQDDSRDGSASQHGPSRARWRRSSQSQKEPQADQRYYGWCPV